MIGNTTTTSVFGRGGGIDVEIVPATIIDSTISGNAMVGPSSRGGGVLILSEGDAPTSLSVFNSTIADNTINGDDSRGGGVRFQSYGDPGASVPPTGLFESTIIAGNTATSGSAIQIEDSPDVVASHSLIQGTIAINPGQGGALTPDATTSALMGQDPLLRPLAWNGGPTFTQTLRCGSPAIDAGSNVTGVQFDQRGHGFPQDRAQPGYRRGRSALPALATIRVLKNSFQHPDNAMQGGFARESITQVIDSRAGGGAPPRPCELKKFRTDFSASC